MYKDHAPCKSETSQRMVGLLHSLHDQCEEGHLLPTESAHNGLQNGDESSDSLSDLDDQFDDASEFASVNSKAFHTNGHLDASADDPAEDHGLTGDEPPAKRQRLRDSTPPPRPRQKPISPPWKKIEAEGPTSFIENGRRKSGRTNFVPTEMQPAGNQELGRGRKTARVRKSEMHRRPRCAPSEHSGGGCELRRGGRHAISCSCLACG